MFPSEDQFHAAMQKRGSEKEEIVQRLVASGFLAKEMGNDPTLPAEISDELHSGIIGFLLSTQAKLECAWNSHRAFQLVHKDVLYPGRTVARPRGGKVRESIPTLDFKYR
jgi:hypothetical protein